MEFWPKYDREFISKAVKTAFSVEDLFSSDVDEEVMICKKIAA